MNRQQRRKLERKGTVTSSRDGFRPIQMKRGPTIEEFDANTMFRLKFDIKAPGGPLRSDHPSQLAGVIEARNESDLMRGVLVKLLDVYGYTPHDRAVSGVIGEVLNPLPRRLRGNIAFALIEGLGLSIGLDEEEVCDDPKCGAVKERGIHPDPENAACATDEPCVKTPEGEHHEDCIPMLDLTVHAPECHVHRETDKEARPLRPAAYKREEVIVVNNPRHYEPLNNKAIDPETGDVTDVVPETGGVSDDDVQSTVDADAADEPFVFNEEDEDVRRAGEHSAATDDAVAGEPGTGSESEPTE